jgi:hypothetical protein
VTGNIHVHGHLIVMLLKLFDIIGLGTRTFSELKNNKYFPITLLSICY